VTSTATDGCRTAGSAERREFRPAAGLPHRLPRRRPAGPRRGGPQGCGEAGALACRGRRRARGGANGAALEGRGPPTQVSGAVLLAPITFTHSADTSQRHLALQIASRAGGDLVLKTPPSAKAAPPGCYMLTVTGKVAAHRIRAKGPGAAQGIA
jgi:hypothetical protein